MANYDYRCKSCQKITEAAHSMNENPEIECSECGSTDTYRIISGGTGAIFKANKGGLRVGPKRQSWDWARKRPNPVQGHRITAEERRAIEEKTVKKYEKQIEGEMTKKSPTVTKAVTNILKHDANKIKGDNNA